MAKSAVVLSLLFIGMGVVEAVSPVQKVIELLEEYKGKVSTDLAAEEKSMAEYAEFCDSESSEKGYAIKTADKKIAELKADIEDATAQIADNEAEVATLGTEMASKEKQLDEATAVRAAEKAAFQKNEAELLTSIEELESAVSTLKKSAAPSLVQLRASAPRKMDLKSVMKVLSSIVDASWVNAAGRRQIQGLVQTEESEDSEDLTLAAPTAAAYESATGGIAATMEEMEEKAEKALSDARNTETNEAHSHDMMAQSLTDAIEVAKEKTADAKSQIQTVTQEMGESKDQLMETTKSMEADVAYLKSLTADCDGAKEAWAARQEEAKAEMEALGKAKEILSERVRVFVQVKGRMQAQVRKGDDDSSEGLSDAQQQKRQMVIQKLKDLGHKFGSYALMEMVTAVAADPFEKVKGLIEEMIAKLVNEANQEATQKAFCDEEMSKSAASKAEKTETLDKLQSRLDTATSTKAELEETISSLEAEIADLDKATAEATKIRETEKATFATSSKDYKDAAEAVESAIGVLKDYYEGAASLAQTGERKGTQPTFGGKKGDAANTILSILEMAGEDFTKTYMELTQQETMDEAEYEKLMSESATSKAAKMAEVKGSESEIKSLEVALGNHKEDFDTTSAELDAVNGYVEKLKPQCESKAMSYEEKKSRREAELEGLKEALSILSA